MTPAIMRDVARNSSTAITAQKPTDAMLAAPGYMHAVHLHHTCAKQLFQTCRARSHSTLALGLLSASMMDQGAIMRAKCHA